MRFPHPVRTRRERRMANKVKIARVFGEALTLALNGARPEVKYTIRHEKQPPAPRPERLTVVYQMQDGREYRTFIPFHGQRSWTEGWPRWLNPGESNMPPVSIRYEFGYEDGGM